MWDTSARLLRLLSLLQMHRDWTGPQLSQRLGVSTRTVRVDVERLRSLGYPVEATRGAAGGYRLGAGATLPPLLLDDDEAVAVAVGLRTATGDAVAGLEESSLRALAKLEQVLPSRLRQRVGALQSSVVAVPRRGDGPSVAPEVLTAVAVACRDHERLRFDYADHAAASSRREAEPYRLVTWGRRWYLVAWDVERADWRTFRVDRIALRSPNGARFSPRPLPADDIATYVSTRVARAAQPHRARLLVHASAAIVLDRINPMIGTVEALDPDSCVLHTGSGSLQSVAVSIGLLGLDFTVLDPPELVEEVRLLAERYARASAGSSPSAQPMGQTTPASPPPRRTGSAAARTKPPE